MALGLAGVPAGLGGLSVQGMLEGEDLWYLQEMGVEVFCAYVATLPRASADTDHSRQMKSLLFLKSSRQGAATGFY